MAQHDLSKILNPELFDRLYRLRFPWAKDHKLTMAEVDDHLNNMSSTQRPLFYDLCFEPALIPLSKIPFNDIPDPMQFLPPPESPNFPQQAIGMLLLLDQSTRMTIIGLSSPWLCGFFDPLAQRLLRQILAVPKAWRPDNYDRWAELGFSFEHYTLCRNHLYMPLAHSEDYGTQMLQLGLLEEFRREVEVHFHTIDPARAHDLADAEDVTAFKRLACEGPPVSTEEHKVTFYDYLFYEMRMSRVHEPIVRKFGRNPYINAAKGREHSEAEIAFFKETGNWAQPPEKMAREMIECVKAGKWQPLTPKVKPGTSS